MTVDDRDVVSTWIVLDTAETSSYYPQAGRTPSSDASIHRIYWNCVVTFYAVAQRTLGAQYAYVLFTNVENLESAAGSTTADMLRSLHVEIVCIPRVRVTPPNYHSGWANQFYIIDILKHIALDPPDRAYLILDSDCIIAHSLDPLSHAAREHGFLTYDTGVPPDKPITASRGARWASSSQNSVRCRFRRLLRPMAENSSRQPELLCSRCCRGSILRGPNR